ncbi:hypothetical protein Si116_01965 [Streptococcus infantarius subsp. infantarius]|nr:hypothetical protein [Streptococcus infantarius subsp. infantarius]MCO4518526.1 hypothetical protein [Streptococcus infantarius subsp. infantarius]
MRGIKLTNKKLFPKKIGRITNNNEKVMAVILFEIKKWADN